MTPAQRRADREPIPVLPMPCAGIRCDRRRTCSHYAANDYASVWVVRMHRCAHFNGEPLAYVEVEPHRPLSEPDTEWGV